MATCPLSFMFVTTLAADSAFEYRTVSLKVWPFLYEMMDRTKMTTNKANFTKVKIIITSAIRSLSIQTVQVRQATCRIWNTRFVAQNEQKGLNV